MTVTTHLQWFGSIQRAISPDICKSLTGVQSPQTPPRQGFQKEGSW